MYGVKATGTLRVSRGGRARGHRHPRARRARLPPGVRVHGRGRCRLGFDRWRRDVGAGRGHGQPDACRLTDLLGPGWSTAGPPRAASAWIGFGSEVERVSDVVVLCWPSDAEDVIRLHDHGVPCLLLLDAAADPPDLGSLLVDWVRLPADDRDLTARLSRLRRQPPPRPAPDAGRVRPPDLRRPLGRADPHRGAPGRGPHRALRHGRPRPGPGRPRVGPVRRRAPTHCACTSTGCAAGSSRSASRCAMLRGSGYLLQIADAPPARPSDTRRPTVTADRRPVAASGGRVISAPPLAATVERSGLGTRRPLAAVGLGTVGVLVIAVALVPFHATVPRRHPDRPPAACRSSPRVSSEAGCAAGAVTVEAVAVLATGFLPPVFSPRVTLAEDIAALAVFVAVAVVLGSLVAHVVAADRHRIALGEARAVALEQVDRQRRTLLSLGLPRPADPTGHDPRRRRPTSGRRAARRVDPRPSCCGLVVDESERLDRLVANLLSLSRIEAGTFAPDRQAVDLTELVRSCDGPFGAAPRRSRRRASTCPTTSRSSLADHDPDRPGRDQPARERGPARPGRVRRSAVERRVDGAGRVVVSVADAGPGVDPALRQPRASSRSGRGRATAVHAASGWPPARRSWRPTAVPSPSVTRPRRRGVASPSRSPLDG